MENLPTEVLTTILDCLELTELGNAMLVNSYWRLVAMKSRHKRKNICVDFEEVAQLIAFNTQFSLSQTLPVYRFHFGDGLLTQAPSRAHILEFAEKFGDTVVAYSFRSNYWSPGGDVQEKACVQANIGLLLVRAGKNLLEIYVTVYYELGPMGLPRLYPKLNTISIKYTRRQFEDYDQTFLSEISSRVPAIRSFGVHIDTESGNQDRGFLRKLPKIFKNLAEMNNMVEMELTFRVYVSDIPCIEQLYKVPTAPRISHLCVMLMTSTWSISSRQVSNWTIPIYNRCYDILSKLLFANAQYLKGLTLMTSSRSSDTNGNDGEDGDRVSVNLEVPKLPAIKYLDIEMFQASHSLGFHPFRPDHLPKLESMRIDMESILLFPELGWPGIRELFIDAHKHQQEINFNVAERLALVFSNVQELTISLKTPLIQLALELTELRKLRILAPDVGTRLDYWTILTGMKKKVIFEELCNAENSCSDNVHSFKQLKRLQGLEIVSDSGACVAGVIYLSMIGQLPRLKELEFRIQDKTKFPDEHFIQELKLHHDCVKFQKHHRFL